MIVPVTYDSQSTLATIQRGQKGGFEIGLADRHFVHATAMRAVDLDFIGPNRAEALRIRFDAGGHTAVGLGTGKE
jgi:hypothetical protein